MASLLHLKPFLKDFPKVCNCFCRAIITMAQSFEIHHRNCKRKLGTRFKLLWNSLPTHLTMCLPRLTHAFRTCFCKVWSTCQLAHVLQVEMFKSTCELHKTPLSPPHPENETEKTMKKAKMKKAKKSKKKKNKKSKTKKITNEKSKNEKSQNEKKTKMQKKTKKITNEKSTKEQE